MTDQIVFIGGGNMASALISGLLKRGVSTASIVVIEPFEPARERLQHSYGIQALACADASMADASLVVWAVKPQVFKEAALGLASLTAKALHLSVAAGIRSDSIAAWLGTERVIRAMPNTPALIGKGVCGLFARSGASTADQARVAELMQTTGQFIWLDTEDKLDAVTALSGSGPAYVFYMMEAMVAAGVQMKLTPAQATDLVLGTFIGASELAQKSAESPQTLRHQVTSKGGTTHAAITALENAGFAEIVSQAVYAAQKRARELGDQFGAP